MEVALYMWQTFVFTLAVLWAALCAVPVVALLLLIILIPPFSWLASRDEFRMAVRKWREAGGPIDGNNPFLIMAFAIASSAVLLVYAWIISLIVALPDLKPVMNVPPPDQTSAVLVIEPAAVLALSAGTWMLC